MVDFMCILRPCTSRSANLAQPRIVLLKISYLRSLKSPSKQTTCTAPMVSCHARTPPGPAGWYFAAPQQSDPVDSTCDGPPHAMFAISGGSNWNSKADLLGKFPSISCNFGWSSAEVSISWPDDIPLHFQMMFFPAKKKTEVLNASSHVQPASAGCISWASQQPPVPLFTGPRTKRSVICSWDHVETNYAQNENNCIELSKHNGSYGF